MPVPALPAARSTQQPGALDLQHHVGECHLHRLELDQRLAELPALLDVRDRAVQRRLTDRQAHGGVAQALDVERGEQLAEAAGRHQQVLLGHLDIFEDHVRGGDAAEAHQLLLGAEADAGPLRLDDERADAAGARLVGQPGVDEVVVGLPAVGDPPLEPVEPVDAVGVLRAGGHVGGAGAGVGLGDRDGHRAVALDDRRKVARALLLGAEQVDHLRRAGVGLEDLERGRPALLGQLLDHDQRVEQGRAGAAEPLRQRDAEEAERAQVASLLDRDGGAVGVPLGGPGRVALLGHRGRDRPDLVPVGSILHATPPSATIVLRAKHDIRKQGYPVKGPACQAVIRRPDEQCSDR